MFKFDDIKKLSENLKEIEKTHDRYIEACVKEVAARLLAKVIQNTPVGGYWEDEFGKKHKIKNYYGSGTLRKGWTGGTNAAAFAKSAVVKKEGNTYTIEITNPVEYAEYVEYGHRTRNHKRWIPGKFMLTLSENELQKDAPAIIEKKLQKMFEDMQND